MRDPRRWGLASRPARRSQRIPPPAQRRRWAPQHDGRFRRRDGGAGTSGSRSVILELGLRSGRSGCGRRDAWRAGAHHARAREGTRARLGHPRGSSENGCDRLAGSVSKAPALASRRECPQGKGPCGVRLLALELLGAMYWNVQDRSSAVTAPRPPAVQLLFHRSAAGTAALNRNRALSPRPG
jgi:hypothetical protein